MLMIREAFANTIEVELQRIQEDILDFTGGLNSEFGKTHTHEYSMKRTAIL